MVNPRAIRVPTETRYPKEKASRPHVIIVGGGVAGLAAAHRLLERGHDITLIEENSFLGGKLGAHQEHDDLRQYGDSSIASSDFGARDCTACVQPCCCKSKRADDWHEHCYHMYLNWYHNFWALMRDIGSIDRFEPMTDINHLVPDPDAPALRAVNPGSPWTAVQNMMSGVSPPADVFLGSMSMLDLLATRDSDIHRLDQMSVEAFLLDQPYTTPDSRKASHRVLAKAFAAPSAMASAGTYRSFLKYGARLPEPTMWLLDGHTQEAIFGPWLKKLARLSGQFTIEWNYQDLPAAFREARDLHQSLRQSDHGDDHLPSFTLMPLRRLFGMEIDPETGEFLLRLSGLDHSPTPQTQLDEGETKFYRAVWRFDGQVVLAVPPRQLAGIVHSRAKDAQPDFDVCLAAADPNLANATRLNGAPIMTLDIRFRQPLAKPLPRGIVLLLGSRYEMSVYDNSQVWRTETADHSTGPMISVCASDAHALMPFVGQHGGAQVIVDLLLRELQRFIRFDRDADILHCRTRLQTNAGEELFINAVDTWSYRPGTTTALPDLFIAGDFVQTPVDVVTIEGAALSGLMAAEAVRRRTGKGQPVPIVLPDSSPSLMWRGLPPMRTHGCVRTTRRFFPRTDPHPSAVRPACNSYVRSSRSRPGAAHSDPVRAVCRKGKPFRPSTDTPRPAPRPASRARPAERRHRTASLLLNRCGSASTAQAAPDPSCSHDDAPSNAPRKEHSRCGWCQSAGNQDESSCPTPRADARPCRT
jgi:uncharacterized protein with NAD-binding domain and iron-sulfur cluster